MDWDYTQMTLNPAQQAAVDSVAALKVVIAGPGSGKTRTMVEAVFLARVCAQSAGRVAIMTFTNAGANEFRQRLGDMTLAYCGTLHGYCFKLIQRFGGFLSYIPGKVGILPDAERIPRLLTVRDKLGLKVSQKAILDPGFRDEPLTLIWREYEFLLKRNNLVDYDGILDQGLALLAMPEVRCQIKLDYLFVDEYQDSAAIDQEIYRAIPAENKMFVGDPDQSIFAFRGAHPAGMVKLVGLAGDHDEVHKLELNYRSDSMICVAANRLIAHNKERVEKVILPVSVEDGTAIVAGFEDVGQELSWITSHLVISKAESCAVLYRMNHDVKVCRDYLRGRGIPVQTPKFEQRPADWERALLILQLALVPENEILAERYLKLDYHPQLVDQWMRQRRAGIANEANARILKLSVTLDSGEGRLLAENGVSEATIAIITARAELLGPDANNSDLLHDLHSNEDTKEPETKGVYVGTIHSAKGREWDVVFLPAFEQGVIPSLQSMKVLEQESPGIFERSNHSLAQTKLAYAAIEEERRLAFVAVTRAKHELYISHCAHRKGPWGPVGLGQPSQFIKEMGL